MAAGSVTGVYSVTGGPLGRVLVQDGRIPGVSSLSQATALKGLVGGTADALLDRVEARARTVQYTDPTQCAAAVTSCDAEAAAELYPY